MTTEIILKQQPIIEHDLYTVGKLLQEQLNSINAESLIATEETVSFLKNKLAEVNKLEAEYEEQRKVIKKLIMAPYDELEIVYKLEIIERCKKVKDILKNLITEVDGKRKQAIYEDVKNYFVELVLAEEIDFLDFSMLGIEIKLSDSIKSYKDRIKTFVDKVKDELAFIDTQNFKAEILVEYKKTLNAAKAIKEVSDRKEAERIEKDRLQMAQTASRKSQLTALGFVYHDMTRTMNHVSEDAIYIKFSELESMSNQEWNVKYAELKQSITPAEIKQPDILRPPTPVYEAPKAETFTATFEVEGTRAQLIALGDYMKANNITYKNI